MVLRGPVLRHGYFFGRIRCWRSSRLPAVPSETLSLQRNDRWRVRGREGFTKGYG